MLLLLVSVVGCRDGFGDAVVGVVLAVVLSFMVSVLILMR